MYIFFPVSRRELRKVWSRQQRHGGAKGAWQVKQEASCCVALKTLNYELSLEDGLDDALLPLRSLLPGRCVSAAWFYVRTHQVLGA